MPQRGNRRELLAESAIEVLAREGGRGLTHRAIDREAGVPEGTTKNYHPTRSSLFIAVARHIAAEHTSALRELRERMPEGLNKNDIATLYATMLRRMVTDARSRFLALFELHLEGVRRPEVRSALGEIALANVDTAVHLHAAVGERISQRGGALLEAGMLGVALTMLSQPDDVLRQTGFDDAEALARALLSMTTTSGPVPGVLRGRAS
ncbi:TetR family transcriptional regulator [Saccharopolyspora erythraea NRRL 2338]|uniref:Possible transcriptional regulator, TetR family n=2 Tax=Saccharopolyspora erythraea TaxID=1836 RepID=A4FBS2_SACEN|nr:TetR/AcrR family transcriptional regulator [Saccharopolyspora erythraea]EQD87535.1 TetR family transcriptional regulator [Saccharopolyspora erythraea D]PFG95275.1 TetR family transcriptional regulator [Saccharopolyspora erythraea NRRL 2338]QRK91924.1 TetR/AcrR family transcriptional regulator [Saccharopolyspora erythraea]CAM01497.1 possible transcriptional regulator, TetR family [Saccharopolyspora erythraea NRRL 2338]